MELKLFDKRFENFLRASGITNKRICWTCIIRFIDKNWYINDLIGSSSGNRLVKFCVGILMEHDCSDKTFLYKLLEFYFRWHHHNCICEDKTLGSEFMYYVMNPLKILESHEIKPFSEIDFESLPSCISDVKFMMVLSKYGIHADSSVFNVDNARNSLIRFFQHIIDDDQARDFSPHLLTAIATHVVESFVRNNGRLYFNKQQRGENYIYLIARILHAVSLALSGDPFSSNFVKCMRVFYMTVSDPYVCQTDVIHFLQFLWVLLPFELISLVSVFETYVRLFKHDNTRIYGPRSLKHLCRVSVRNCLRKNMKMLPQSVRSLHIPRALHDYLLCILTSPKDFTCGYVSQ